MSADISLFKKMYVEAIDDFGTDQVKNQDAAKRLTAAKVACRLVETEEERNFRHMDEEMLKVQLSAMKFDMLKQAVNNGAMSPADAIKSINDDQD